MPEDLSYYENFKEIEKKIWSLLTNAVKDRSSEYRTPVFICGNEKDLDGRVVVLRKADPVKNFIQFPFFKSFYPLIFRAMLIIVRNTY